MPRLARGAAFHFCILFQWNRKNHNLSAIRPARGEIAGYVPVNAKNDSGTFGK